ncbi:hypothetical protein NDA16_003723 [Ustilago loliicola]|nr:hypothetical protein NDA16_003723 [Ustilago loliicola]
MRVLRVMIKTKDVLVDPDNAWKSASRIKAPCNAAIRLCLHHGRVERALKLFNSMKKDGIFPSAATYTVIINRLSRLIEQQIGPPSARSPEVLLQSKEVQRIRDLYHDIEKFWKQAFPMYFQRGAAGARPQSNDIMALDRDGFDKLTEQACRNLISQQASVKEIREHPKVFTHTIGAYLHFLRLVGTRDELTQLFDRLFPSTLIDTMAKGLAPNASPQDKLELANRNLSEWLPLGDVSTFSAFFFEKWESPHSERVATVERIWSRLSKLMDLELHERRTTTQGASRQYKQPKPPASKDENPIAAGQHAESDQPRFVPDDQLMIDIFNHLQPPTNAGPAPDLRLGLDIVSKVYGLDLESTADGIVRAHQSEQSDVSSGLRRYFTADANAIDGRAQPVAILRDSTVAMSLSRMLFGRELRNQRIALFNYLWAQGFADQQAAKSHDDAVGSAISDATTFGKTLRPTFVLNVLWDLCEAGDPVGARIILEAMKRTAQAASSGSPSTQDATNRRARRTRQATGHSDQNDAQDWKPSILSYLRVMRANLTALLKGPGGLTATIVGENGSHTTDSAVKEHGYDAWTEAKSLFAEWCDQKKFDSGSRQTSSRWASSEVHADHQDSRTGRKNGAARGDLPDALNRIHMDNMRSLFLHTAKICAVQQADKGAEVAREALNLVNDKIGLEVLVKEAEKLRDDVAIASKKAKARIHKVRTLDYLSKIIDLALDTSDHSFAPKADVELWKGVRKMLPASSVPADKADFKGGRDARKQLGGSNRLLLSKDDYRELEAEAEAEAEDEEDSEQGEDEQSPRGLYRMQRRSRHVEQELERWVRGAST